MKTRADKIVFTIGIVVLTIAVIAFWIAPNGVFDINGVY